MRSCAGRVCMDCCRCFSGISRFAIKKVFRARSLRNREEALAAIPGRQRETLEGRLDSIHEALRVHKARSARRYDEAAPLSCRRLLWRIPWWLTNPARLPVLASTLFRMPRDTSDFLATYAPGASCAIVGHFHRGGVWRFGDRTVVNTGSFTPAGASLLARVEPGVVTALGVRRAGRRFVPGEKVAEIAIADRTDSITMPGKRNVP